VQDSQSARGQVALAAEGVQQTTPRGRLQSDRHGIDREIAPSEVLVYRGRAHVRQGARHAITLATGRRDVHAPDPRAIGRHAALERRRAEGGVDHQVTARLVRESPPKGDAVALHDEVEVGHARSGLREDTAEEEIPDEASDCVDRLSLRLRKLARGAQQPEPRLFLGAMHALEPHCERSSRSW
jgi:hypothetical protein